MSFWKRVWLLLTKEDPAYHPGWALAERRASQAEEELAQMREVADELIRLIEDLDLYNDPQLQESLEQLRRGEVEQA